MSTRTVTVFVARRNGVLHAATMNVEAIHESSATVAARRCAATHFGVDERAIELTPHGPHTLIAGVREHAPARAFGFVLACVVSAAVGFVAVCLVFRGGAQ